MKFTVSRKTWLRGTEATTLGKSYLLHPDNYKMCCLGFLARACGATDRDILRHHSPRSTDVNVISWPEDIKPCVGSLSGMVCNSILTDSIMNVNDDDTLDDNQRETELKRLFAIGNIEIEFEE